MPCTGREAQIWVPWGGSNLRNHRSTLCLVVPDGTRAKGAKMISWSCLGGRSQTWIMYATT